MTTYELADFEPSDGHRHGCPEAIRLAGECDCAALLFCIAQDLSIEVTDLRREVPPPRAANVMRGDGCVGRCECGKTLGHVLSPGSPCWPVPLPAGEPPHRRIGYSDPDSPAARRIAAEWADLEPTPPRPR